MKILLFTIALSGSPACVTLPQNPGLPNNAPMEGNWDTGEGLSEQIAYLPSDQAQG